MKYAKNILDIVGNTPLVKLNKLSGGIKATVLMKLEYVNPGGSIKDRMALQIVKDAEKAGKLKKGYTIIEATGAGNTGIGLAIVAAIRGYRTIFTMPDKNSNEKINLLKAYGAEVVVCPTNVLPDDPRSYYKVAERLAGEIPNSFFARQYQNPSNPKTHYLTTGPEIWEQTDGKITHFVAGMGTGGTISGIGKFLKEKKKDIKIIGVDPIGSLFYDYFYKSTVESRPKTYRIEGIGEDFIPETIDFSYIDEVIQVNDKQAYGMARSLASTEGLLPGSSSGAAVFATLKIARDLPKDSVIVTLLPDTGRNYLSKIYNDDWMRENGFLEKEAKNEAMSIL